MPDSWVLGNSSQLNRLTADERARLDQEPWVFVCNLFPSHWKQLRFRPTVWVFGDTKRRSCCQILSEQLDAILDDTELKQRLRHIYVCAESELAERILAEVPLEIFKYRRGNPRKRQQVKADSIDRTIYHYTSTLTDVVNLAWLLNPGQPVRLCGCQYATAAGHFYELPEPHMTAEFENFVHQLWEGLSDLRKQGIDIIDCNFEHGSEIPADLALPRETVFAASIDTSARGD